MLSSVKVEQIARRLLKFIGEEFPEISVSELLSALFTLNKNLVQVVLETRNDEHNRSELLRCIQSIQEEVWLRELKDKNN